MSFLLLKHLHMFFVASSYTLFFLRGVWSMQGSAIMRQRWVKIVPHTVDTLLLACALALAHLVHQYPFVNAWLTAKVIGLLLYIALGFVVMRSGLSKPLRFSAWLVAQGVFAYIVMVAVTRNPVPW